MGLAAVYVDADTFTVTGDYADAFVANRKVKANCGVDGLQYVVVLSSSYGAPNTTVNLTADSDDLTANLTEVVWSVMKPGAEGNVALHDHSDEDTGDDVDVSGIVSDAAYAAGWDADTTHAASKNAVYDKIETLLPTAKPSNSKGNSFATVQEAITDLAGDGWVFVPAGTWSENIGIPDNNVTLFGTGWGSIIDGAATGHAIVIGGEDCLIRDLQCKTTPAQGNVYYPIRAYAALRIQIIRVYASQSDNHGIQIENSHNAWLKDCHIENTDNYGVNIRYSTDVKVIGNYLNDIGNYGIYGDDCLNTIIVANKIDTVRQDGIILDAGSDDCLVVGNRITNIATPFDNGSVEFTADETLTGNTAGSGIVASWVVTTGAWGTNDAAGFVFMNHVTAFINNETMTGSVTGVAIASGGSNESIDNNSGTGTVASNDTT